MHPGARAVKDFERQSDRLQESGSMVIRPEERAATAIGEHLSS
jgi:hypothetical protein